MKIKIEILDMTKFIHEGNYLNFKSQKKNRTLEKLEEIKFRIIKIIE